MNQNEEQGLSLITRDEILKNSKHFTNIGQDYITTTTDKIKIVLNETKEIILSKHKWETPFGLLISCCITFITILTIEFKDPMPLKHILLTIFAMLSFGSLYWLIKSIRILIKHRGQDDLTIIIEKLKSDNKN